MPVLAARPARVHPDQLRDGWRLACLRPGDQDLAVEVPPLVTRPKAATVGVGRQVILRPGRAEAVRRARPSRRWPTSAPTCERLLDAIDDLELAPTCTRCAGCPTVLRAADFKVTAVVVDDVLIDVEPGDTTDTRFAIAFDLGTTTVVATLLDLATGTPAAVASMLNKQQPFGADVITRISATMMDPDALGRLRDARPRDPGRARRRGVRRGAGSSRARSTRSRWPATPR